MRKFRFSGTLIRLSNNSVSQAMYKERKQIMSTSLDSIRYLHLHDTLPPDFSANVFSSWMEITIFLLENYLKVIS